MSPLRDIFIFFHHLKSPSLLPLFKPHVTVACLGKSEQTIRSATPSAASANYLQVVEAPILI